MSLGLRFDMLAVNVIAPFISARDGVYGTSTLKAITYLETMKPRKPKKSPLTARLCVNIILINLKKL